MKNIILSTALMVIILAADAFAQTASTDETAIRGNVAQMVTGWNLKSGEEFGKPFAADCDYVVINGMRLRGRAQVATAHQRIFDTVYKDSTLAYSVESVRFLRPDVAIVHVSAELNVPSQVAGKAVITLVMAKNNKRWEITAFQNTAVQAATGK